MKPSHRKRKAVIIALNTAHSSKNAIMFEAAIYKMCEVLAEQYNNKVKSVYGDYAYEKVGEFNFQPKAKRKRVLKDVKFVDGVLGQYENYCTHEACENSTTETYARIEVAIQNKRWKDVPFYLETGKCLAEKETAIYITFKTVGCLLTNYCPQPKNVLKIAIFPRSGFVLELNGKKVGDMNGIIPVEMEFCHECLYGLYTPLAYEVILEEVMEGLRGISVSIEEIELSWRLIDTIKKAELPLKKYACGSNGPKDSKSPKNSKCLGERL